MTNIRYPDEDYDDPTTLEHWLGTVFGMRVVPHFIVGRFDQWEDDICARLKEGKDVDLIQISGLSTNQIRGLIEASKVDIAIVRRILSSANQLPDGTLLLGARHWDHMMHAQMRTYLKAHGIHREEIVVDKTNTGFVDTWGNYLTRRAAWVIAERQGQIRFTGPGFSGPDLYSENLW